MKLLDYMKIYPLLTSEECDYVLGEVKNYNYYQALTTKVGNEDIEPQLDTYRTNSQTVIPHGTVIDSLIYERVSLAYARWMDDLPELEKIIWRNHYRNVSDTGYEVNRYEVNQYYDWHIDVLPTKKIDRILSFVLYLNDDYEGGELQFPFCKYTPQKGHAVIFPSTWMYPHTSTTITKGTKYSLVTWMINNWDQTVSERL